MANNVRKDSRFAHIAHDPRFKRIPKNERKVKIDKRFQSMFNDGKFKLKYTVDKRGRPGAHTSNEDLKRYYDLSSEESDLDSDSEEEKEEEKEEEEVKKDSSTKSNKTSTTQDCDDEGIEQSSSEPENDLETGDLGLSETIIEKLHDTKVDYARGEAVLVTDSSSDEETSEDELEADVRELDHGWGELDRDADRTEEATSRLAVCNMDWDRIRCADLMVLFSSFLPPGGIVHTITIYPSDFGIERMKKEEASGPIELTEGSDKLNKDDDDDDDDRPPEDENEEGSKYHMEKLRQYQLARLKYYYAVAVFDLPSSANKVYTECDGMEYESSATRLDLRFVPEDTTFEQEPREVCDRLPEPSKYEPRQFTTTALQQAKVELTWDETDPKRGEITRKIAAGTADDADVQVYLASSSGEDEPEEEGPKSGSDDELPAAKAGDDPMAKYRALLQGIESAEEKKKSRGVEMEVTWGLGLKDKTQKLVNKRIKEGDGLTPFQQMMEKKKEKKRAKREERKMKLEKVDQEEDGDSNPYSDDDIPSDIDMNDPYFKDEIKDEATISRKKEKKKGKKLDIEEDEESLRKKAELELLLMEEDDNRQHFNLKDIQEKESATSGSKKKRKKMKRRAEKDVTTNDDDDFQMNVKDDRFSAIYSSHHFNIDPADPHFRKTKAMEALRAEKLKRRNEAQHDSDQQVQTKVPKILTGKKCDPELSLLVKSVKRKSLGK